MHPAQKAISSRKCRNNTSARSCISPQQTFVYLNTIVKIFRTELSFIFTIDDSKDFPEPPQLHVAEIQLAAADGLNKNKVIGFQSN